MLPRLQLSLAAFVLGPTIVGTIRLTIFAVQSSIPGPRMAVGTCKSQLSKCSRRSKERKREPLVPWCQMIESLERRVASLEEERNRRDELDAAAVVALQRYLT
jgi:hypothetical protein